MLTYITGAKKPLKATIDGMIARRFGRGLPYSDLGLDARCYGTFGASPYGGMICSLSPEYTLIAPGWKGPDLHFH